MRKLLLTSIISATLLTACDDKPADQVTNKVAETADKAVQVVKSDASPAEQAEQMFDAMSKAAQKYYQTFLATHPMVESITYEKVSYEKGENSATAITKAVLKLKVEIEDKKTFDLSFKHDIKYDAAVLAAGLIAKIDSTVIQPEGLDTEQAELFKEFEKHFSYTTDIGKDQSVNQDMALKPFTFNPDDADTEKTVTFKGININSKTTIKDIGGGFGQFLLDFKGISDTDGSGIEPFGLQGEYQSNGDFSANSTTPLIIRDKQGGGITVDSFAAKGNMKMNEKFDMMIGSGQYELKNIQVNSQDMPFPVSLQSATVDFESAINDKDILSQQVDMKLIPADGLVSNLSQGMLDVSQANLHFDLDNIPASVMVDYNDMMADTFESMNDITDGANSIDYSDKQKEKLAAMFDKVKATGGQLSYKLDLATNEGNILLDGETKVKSDSAVTLTELMESSSPEALLQALDLKINASVPAKLLEMIAGENIIMVGMFMTKEGDTYQSKITTENGQVMINGVPAPF